MDRYTIEVDRNQAPKTGYQLNQRDVSYDYIASVRSTITGAVVHSTQRCDTASEARREAQEWIRNQQR